MRRVHFTIAAVMLAGIACAPIEWAAQTSASNPQNSAASPAQVPKLQFAPGALLRAELAKAIDAKKAKVGDVVVAKLTDDLKSNVEVLAPKGSEILAHITQVAQHQGDSPSVLGITFDKLVLKDGSDLAFKAVIQAIGFPDAATADQAVAGGTPGSRGPTPGQFGGAGGTMGQPSAYPGTRIPSASSDTRGSETSGLKLSPNAKGVVGISGASLSTDSSLGSVISSQKHNVKLESGAQMILRIQ